MKTLEVGDRKGRALSRIELDDVMRTPWPYRPPTDGREPNEHGHYLGDEIRQYCCGVPFTHAGHTPDTHRAGGLARVTQRLDGFVSVDADQGGVIHIRARLSNNLDRRVEGGLHVTVPGGWTCEAPTYQTAMAPYESRRHAFALTAPAEAPPGPVAGVRLEGRIGPVSLPAREVRGHVVAGLGIDVAFDPMTLSDGSPRLAGTVSGAEGARLTWEVHPARHYRIGTLMLSEIRVR